MKGVEYSVVLPVLNEVENLKCLLPQLLDGDCEVIVCDNGSSDGSVELVSSYLPNSKLRLSGGRGTVTDAILRGLSKAKFGRVIVMDSDMSHPPEKVGELALALGEHDIVVGSRYIRGGGSGDSFRNRFISWSYNLLTYFLAPGIKDRASGFWGVRRELIGTPIRSTVKPMMEYLVRSRHNSVGEVPYVFELRLSGKSKLGRGMSIPRTALDILLLYTTKFRVLNYMVVGGLCYVLNLGVYYPLTLVYRSQVTFLNQVYYLPPFVISTFIAGTAHYLMSRSWTFGDRREVSLGFFKFWSILGPTVLFDIVIIYLLVERFSMLPVVAAAVAMLSVFMVRYTIANKWIWGRRKWKS